MSATPSTRLRGRRAFRLALVFGLVGAALVVAGLLVSQHALSKVTSFQRVAVSSGSGSVSLTADKYVAYFESGKVARGTNRVPLVPVQLTSPSGATTVLDTLYGGKKVKDANGTNDIRSLDYHYHGHNGVALYQFSIHEAGRYRVRLAQPANVPDDAKIAFGPSIATGKIVGSALVTLGVVLLVVAAVLVAVGLVQRRRHKKQLADHALYYGPPARTDPPT
ncbi:MAG TPA: hypothetical protein VFU35_03105 [Jatrophihabitans sp.]|nr:hypothetical protein [Jatrophihabitans sp.]